MTAGILHSIGVFTAIVTMISGLIELGKIEAEKVVNQHMTFVMISWILYATTLFLRLEESQLTAPYLFEISLSISVFLFLCATGWCGGKLVYEHGIGIRNNINSV